MSHSHSHSTAATPRPVGKKVTPLPNSTTKEISVRPSVTCAAKGVDAAVLTALTRHALRAAAFPHPAPSTALRTLNDVLLRHETDRFCTVLAYSAD
jgi:Stage II sporulation protein E (SpoIIE)